MAYAKIHIENLGPIREGTFELRPLTIFIGPNNSGKTYAATAAYAMVNGLAFDRTYREHRLDEHIFGRPPTPTWLSTDPGEGDPIPDDVNAHVADRFDRLRQLTESALSVGFLDAFAVDDLRALRRVDVPTPGLTVSLTHPASEEAVGGIRETTLGVEPFLDVLSPTVVQVRGRGGDEVFPPPAYDDLPGDDIAMEAWGDLLDDLGLPAEGFYLPAGRLGIIQSWPVLASSAINSFRQRAGRIRDELSPLPGVLADSLERFFLLPRPKLMSTEYPKPFRPAGDLLDKDVLGGRIVREYSPLGLMRLIYRTQEFDLPLERASSMVGDLASLSIAIKDQLVVGDLLVLDEPEAHLHPGSEREVAQVIVRLAKAGVRVLLPTHSSTIVNQIGNIVRASYLSESEREGLGFTDDDRLLPEQVGLYQFVPSADGVMIKEIPYDPEFGYAEEGFYEVASALSDESYEIDVRMPVAMS